MQRAGRENDGSSSLVPPLGATSSATDRRGPVTPSQTASSDMSVTRSHSEKPAHYTYVPPFKLLRKALHIEKDDLENGGDISIPASLFKELMAHYLKDSFFDERLYLETNPDVDHAIRIGNIRDALDHYISTGYYEGRSPGLCPVDREWYERHYPDVYRAIKNGLLVDSAEHFHQTGYEEGRAPSADLEPAAETWSGLLLR
jgi:hypothetical protein